MDEKRPTDAMRPEKPQDRPYKADIIADLVELDRDIMKLLVRRAKLVTRLRGGKDHAATPAAAKAEKDVRTAWEKNAASFSRDEKFVRQLFSLVQEVRVDSQAEAASRSGFNLAPARRPVNVDIPGPRSVMASRMLAVLAAWHGCDLAIDHVMLNDPLMDCVKALNNAGARFTWTVGTRIGEGVLLHAGSGRVNSLATDKALYIGEDLTTMYLMAFLAASTTGKARFTGGSGLKMADLSPLRRLLPSLGARLGHSVPKSNGLPGSVESSGIIPDTLILPGDLPREGVVALFYATAAWKKNIRIDCGALPHPLFTGALAECLPLLRACSVEDRMEGTVITLDASGAVVPSGDVCPLDPVLSSYLLSLPAFTGGAVTLGGAWEAALPLSGPVLALLAWGGVRVETGAGSIRSFIDPDAPLNAETLDLRETDASLLPLGLALAVRRAWRAKTETALPLLPKTLDDSIVEGFCVHLGLACRNGKLVFIPEGSAHHEGSSWTSPSPEWAFAYALCAYDRPNIRLGNPTVTSSLMPSFWTFFNSLPDPSEVKVAEKPQKQRRRIIAGRE